jgi:hypothetical protein
LMWTCQFSFFGRRLSRPCLPIMMGVHDVSSWFPFQWRSMRAGAALLSGIVPTVVTNQAPHRSLFIPFMPRVSPFRRCPRISLWCSPIDSTAGIG